VSHSSPSRPPPLHAPSQPPTVHTNVSGLVLWLLGRVRRDGCGQVLHAVLQLVLRTPPD